MAKAMIKNVRLSYVRLFEAQQKQVTVYVY